MSDPYVYFVDEAGDRLEQMVTQFQIGSSSAALKKLEEAVVLCENHPASASHRSETDIASMQDVLEAIVSNAMLRREDLRKKLAMLHRRMYALSRSELH